MHTGSTFLSMACEYLPKNVSNWGQSFLIFLVSSRFIMHALQSTSRLECLWFTCQYINLIK